MFLFGKKLSVLFVVLVDLVKAVAGVNQNVIDELLEKRVVEVFFEVLPEYFIDPQRREDLVNHLSVIELLVKLV